MTLAIDLNFAHGYLEFSRGLHSAALIDFAKASNSAEVKRFIALTLESMGAPDVEVVDAFIAAVDIGDLRSLPFAVSFLESHNINHPRKAEIEKLYRDKLAEGDGDVLYSEHIFLLGSDPLKAFHTLIRSVQAGNRVAAGELVNYLCLAPAQDPVISAFRSEAKKFPEICGLIPDASLNVFKMVFDSASYPIFDGSLEWDQIMKLVDLGPSPSHPNNWIIHFELFTAIYGLNKSDVEKLLTKYMSAKEGQNAFWNSPIELFLITLSALRVLPRDNALIVTLEKRIAEFGLSDIFETSTLETFTGSTLFSDEELEDIFEKDTLVNADEPQRKSIEVLREKPAPKPRSRFGELADIMEAASEGLTVDFGKVEEMATSIFSQWDLLEDITEDDWDIDQLWDFAFMENIENALQLPNALDNSKLVDAVLSLSQFEPHLLCLLAIADLNTFKLKANVLTRISEGQICELDTGRPDSCPGWQMYLGINPNASVAVLRKLNECGYHDMASIKWSLAMNPSTPSDLLSCYARSDEFGWRAEPEIEFGLISPVPASEVRQNVQSYLPWAVAGNPKLPSEDRERLAKITGEELQPLIHPMGWAPEAELLASEIKKRASKNL